MTDVYDKTTRSAVMKRVRSKGNKSTELRMIEIFHTYGITGWRRNYSVKGHPDFVFLRKKVAVFVDGCFWHGHDCRNTRPLENKEYWKKKRRNNIAHDKVVSSYFMDRGWVVIRIWECELKKRKQSVLNAKLKIFYTKKHK